MCQNITPLLMPYKYANLCRNLKIWPKISFWGVTCANTPRNMLLFLHETMLIVNIYTLTEYFASST